MHTRCLSFFSLFFSKPPPHNHRKSQRDTDLQPRIYTIYTYQHTPIYTCKAQQSETVRVQIKRGAKKRDSQHRAQAKIGVQRCTPRRACALGVGRSTQLSLSLSESPPLLPALARPSPTPPPTTCWACGCLPISLALRARACI